MTKMRCDADEFEAKFACVVCEFRKGISVVEAAPWGLPPLRLCVAPTDPTLFYVHWIFRLSSSRAERWERFISIRSVGEGWRSEAGGCLCLLGGVGGAWGLKGVELWLLDRRGMVGMGVHSYCWLTDLTLVFPGGLREDGHRTVTGARVFSGGSMMYALGE